MSEIIGVLHVIDRPPTPAVILVDGLNDVLRVEKCIYGSGRGCGTGKGREKNIVGLIDMVRDQGPDWLRVLCCSRSEVGLSHLVRPDDPRCVHIACPLDIQEAKRDVDRFCRMYMASHTSLMELIAASCLHYRPIHTLPHGASLTSAQSDPPPSPTTFTSLSAFYLDATRMFCEEIAEKSGGCFLPAVTFFNFIQSDHLSHFDWKLLGVSDMDRIWLGIFRHLFPDLRLYRKKTRKIFEVLLSAFRPLTSREIFECIRSPEDTYEMDFFPHFRRLRPFLVKEPLRCYETSLTSEDVSFVVPGYFTFEDSDVLQMSGLPCNPLRPAFYRISTFHLREWLLNERKSFDYSINVKRGHHRLWIAGLRNEIRMWAHNVSVEEEGEEETEGKRAKEREKEKEKEKEKEFTLEQKLLFKDLTFFCALYHFRLSLNGPDPWIVPKLSEKEYRDFALAASKAVDRGGIERVEDAFCRYKVCVSLLLQYGGWNALMYPSRCSILGLCCLYGDYLNVDILLSDPRVPINHQDIDGVTPLYTAARQDQPECVELLLDRIPIQVNIPDVNGVTPLWIAAFHGRDLCLKYLLSHPMIQVNRPNKNGVSPLYAAANRGRDSCVRLLMTHPIIDVNHSNCNGVTPLFVAANRGRVECVKALLSHPKIDINLRRKDGDTPLFAAATLGRLDCLQVLLASPDIDVNIQSHDGVSALWAAANLGQWECVRLLLSHPQIDVNLMDHNQNTPLYAASNVGRAECVRLLLAHPALQVNLQNKNGNTALYTAANLGELECLEILLACPDIEVNLQNKNGEFPLWIAANQGHVDCIEALLRHPNIDVNLQNMNGHCALWVATNLEKEDCVEALLTHPKIDVNIQDLDGTTTLFAAVNQGRERSARLLLSHANIDVNIPNADGDTPLWIAANLGRDACVQMIMQHKRLDISKGRCPLISAIKGACGGSAASIRTIAILLSSGLLSKSRIQSAISFCRKMQSSGHPAVLAYALLLEKFLIPCSSSFCSYCYYVPLPLATSPLLRCPCHAVAYCDSNHQKLDWKRKHRDECARECVVCAGKGVREREREKEEEMEERERVGVAKDRGRGRGEGEVGRGGGGAGGRGKTKGGMR